MIDMLFHRDYCLYNLICMQMPKKGKKEKSRRLQDRCFAISKDVVLRLLMLVLSLKDEWKLYEWINKWTKKRTNELMRYIIDSKIGLSFTDKLFFSQDNLSQAIFWITPDFRVPRRVHKYIFRILWRNARVGISAFPSRAIFVPRVSFGHDHVVGKTEGSGSRNYRMSVNHGLPAKHAHIFCLHICSCLETNPEWGEADIEWRLQCWQLRIRWFRVTCVKSKLKTALNAVGCKLVWYFTNENITQFSRKDIAK